MFKSPLGLIWNLQGFFGFISFLKKPKNKTKPQNKQTKALLDS